MKNGVDHAAQAVCRGQAGIVLVGLAATADPGVGGLPPLDLVSRRLAALLEWPLLELPGKQSPDGALTALAERAQRCAGGWLAGLEKDVGLSLPEGGCWAQVLAAWRQPALLVVPAAQLSGGLPAAGTALLQHWRVPLVGLLQWGGSWQPQARRRDGLPWLGLLPLEAAGTGGSAGGAFEPGEAEQGLAAALRLRWQGLERP